MAALHQAASSVAQAPSPGWGTLLVHMWNGKSFELGLDLDRDRWPVQWPYTLIQPDLGCGGAKHRRRKGVGEFTR